MFSDNLGFAVVMVTIYLLPGIVSVSRKHLNSTAITAMNILIGWTIAGWVASLIWSLTSNTATSENPGSQTAAKIAIGCVFALFSIGSIIVYLTEDNPRPSPRSTAPSNWVVYQDTDSITDEPVVGAVLRLSESNVFDSSSLIIGCVAGSTRLAIEWDDYFYESPEVTTRVGDNDPETQTWQLMSDRKTTRYPSDAPRKLLEMLSSTTFAARTNTPAGGQVTITFDITGISEAIQPTRQACNW